MTTKPSTVAQTTTGVAAGLAIFYFLRPVLVPFFLALLLRVLVGGIVALVIRLAPRAPKWLTVIATAAIVGLGAYGIFIIILQGITDLVKQGPMLPAQFEGLAHLIGMGLGRSLNSATVLGLIDLPTIEHNLASSLGDAMSEGLLTLIFLFFMLLGPGIDADPKVDKFAGNETRARSQRLIFHHIVRGVQAYLVSQTVINFAIAILAAIVFHFSPLADKAFWAVSVFLLAFMPVVGPFVASAGPAMFIALQTQSLVPPLVVFLSVLLIFQVAHNVLLPRIQARSTNTDPLIGILLLGVWTLLWGIPGAILSTPLTVLMIDVSAQFQSTRWLAIVMSHDGNPNPNDSEVIVE